MAKYFRFPFSRQGDKVAVPDETQSDGQLSYNQGYGPDYQRTPGTDPLARRIERNRFNQLLFDITENAQEYSQLGTPPYITAAENGGSAFAYTQYARVRYNPGSGVRVYESLTNNNTNLPTVTTAWRLVDFTGLDDRYGLGSTTPLRTGTADGNIPLIGTPGTTTAGANSAVVVRQGVNTNGFFRIFSNNYHELVINAAFSSANTFSNIDLPVTLPVNPRLLGFVHQSTSTTENGILTYAATGHTTSAIRLRASVTGNYFAFISNAGV